MKFKNRSFVPTLLFSFFLVNCGNAKDIPSRFIHDGAIVSWDFNAGEEMSDSKFAVSWEDGGRAALSIPDTEMKGVRFRYTGNGLDKDSTSEIRYKIRHRASHVFEVMEIYQPVNFYHRSGLKVLPQAPIDIELWKSGDRIVTTSGTTGIVSSSSTGELLVTDYSQNHNYNWGSKKLIVNIENGERVRSDKRIGMPSNNKLSAMWSGTYPNSGMILETTSIPVADGGDYGVSFCRPTIVSRGSPPSAEGKVVNSLPAKKPAACFAPENNGEPIVLVIERKRSSGFRAFDAEYRVWKSVGEDDFELIYEANEFDVYQEGKNYFDNGYLFGWSNSGYNEDTDFYLLSWSLWDKKPNFLP